MAEATLQEPDRRQAQVRQGVRARHLAAQLRRARGVARARQEAATPRGAAVHLRPVAEVLRAALAAPVVRAAKPSQRANQLAQLNQIRTPTPRCLSFRHPTTSFVGCRLLFSTACP